MAFNKELPVWNKLGTKPPQEKLDQGWLASEKPPADWWNWFQNTTYEAIKEIREKSAEKTVAQMYKFTADTGERTRISDGTDILTVSPGFYYGANLSLPNSPVTNDTSWFSIDIWKTPNGMKQFALRRNFDNRLWLGSVHTDGTFRGWEEIATVKTPVWNNITLQNGWTAINTNRPPKYAVKGTQLVFEGSIGSGQFGGTNYLAAFTLPSGVRPKNTGTAVIGGFGNINWAKLYIFHDTGRVCVMETSTGVTGEIDLAGLVINIA